MQPNLPPTPTLYPTPMPSQVAMGLDFPELSLWDSAPQAISTWNSMLPFIQIVQVMTILLIIFGAYVVLKDFLESTTETNL